VIDECQDMTPLLYGAAKKIISVNSEATPKICALGDIDQCVYQFKGADPRFLSLAPQLI